VPTFYLFIRPHRMHTVHTWPTATDVAWPGVSVGHNQEPCKNGWTDRGAISGMDLFGWAKVTGHFRLRQFITETLQHRSDGSKVPWHFGTSTKVCKRHFRPKCQIVQPHGPNCPAIWSEMSHPMVWSVSPKFCGIYSIKQRMPSV